MNNALDTRIPRDALQQIMESAQALGVDFDEEKALQWLTAIAALEADAADVAVDEASGVFAHRVVLLDFDPTDLERLRRVAAIVELDRKSVV